MEKTYTVVVLPKENQETSIEIPKTNIRNSWIDAFELVSEIVMAETGRELKVPRLKTAYSATTPTQIVQIWICDVPFITE